MKKIIIFITSIFIINIANAQWVKVSNDYHYVTSFAIQDSNIFAGTWDAGVFFSTNNGNSWTALNSGTIFPSNVNALAIRDSNIFAGCDGGVFLSTDFGNNWMAINSGIPSYVSVFTLAINDSNILAGTYEYGVYKSSNNGSSWAVSSLNSNSIWAMVSRDSNIFEGSIGVSLTTDNGNSWTPVNNGLTDNSVTSLAIKDSIVCAGTQNGGVFLSINNGNNWTIKNNGLTGNALDITSLIISDSNIFAGTWGDGVHLYSKQGSNWTAVNSGLMHDTIVTLAVNKNYIFAGTYLNGIWRRSLSDFATRDTIKTSASPVIGGSTLGGGSFPLNEICNIEAFPNTGYVFANWTENGNTVSTNSIYSFSVTANRNLVANFTSTQGIVSNTLNESTHIYPNPTKNNLTIETNSNTEHRLEIINLLGQAIYTTYIGRKSIINTSNYACGLYFLKIYTDKEIVVRKFVKE